MVATSLVVTTYNWPQALALCLRSIAAQRVPPLEVIVADDGSRGETGALVRDMAAGFPVPLRHVWQDDQGFRAARVRNLGVAASSGEYLIFLDGDMVLHREFVADHVALVRPGIFLQGGRLNASPAESERLLAGATPRFSPFMPFAEGLRGELKRRHALRIPWMARYRIRSTRGGTVMSCHMGIWRSDLDRVNGFDDAFEGWGLEDDDLAARLRHAGVAQRRLRFAGHAIHLWHPTRRHEGAGHGCPNSERLQRTLRDRAVRCEQGLDAHVARARAAAPLRAVDAV